MENGRALGILDGGGSTRISPTIPGSAAAKEPDEYEGFDVVDPSMIGQTLVHFEGWRSGPTIDNGGTRWRPSALGAQIDTDIFGSRAPGLRPG
jgi:hypothetical protein